MNGRVDDGGRALVQIRVRSISSSSAVDMEAWIDTGFTGDLVLPQAMIVSLGLPQSGTVSAELGDGSTVVMNTFTCAIEWFGNDQQIEVVGNNGLVSLLGVGMLRNHRLTVNYPAQTLTVE